MVQARLHQINLNLERNDRVFEIIFILYTIVKVQFRAVQSIC